jgi:hypothetical protein
MGADSSNGLDFTVNYYDGLQQGGYYSLYVYQCSSYADFGAPNKAINSANVSGGYTVPYFSDGCNKVCCSYEGGVRDGLFYSQVQLQASTVLAAKARIGTMYSSLCAEATGSTANAHQAAYVAIAAVHANGTKMYAEAGYRRGRYQGSANIDSSYFLTIKGTGPDIYFQGTTAPEYLIAHDYEIQLDSVAGVFSYYIDGAFIQAAIDDGWKGISGKYVSWAGEILGHETDMPGTVGTKCSFLLCMADTGLGLRSTGFFGPTTVDTTDDPNEWGVDIRSDDWFEIWDKKPL